MHVNIKITLHYNELKQKKKGIIVMCILFTKSRKNAKQICRSTYLKFYLKSLIFYFFGNALCKLDYITLF